MGNLTIQETRISIHSMTIHILCGLYSVLGLITFVCQKLWHTKWWLVDDSLSEPDLLEDPSVALLAKR